MRHRIDHMVRYPPKASIRTGDVPPIPARHLVVFTGEMFKMFIWGAISSWKQHLVVATGIEARVVFKRAVCCIVTVRNKVAKVTFLQASVCPQGWGGGVCLSACWDTTPRNRHPSGADTPRSRHPPEQTLPWELTPPGTDTPQSRTPGSRHTPGRDGHCCRRYTSYWNAFLF